MTAGYQEESLLYKAVVVFMTVQKKLWSVFIGGLDNSERESQLFYRLSLWPESWPEWH